MKKNNDIYNNRFYIITNYITYFFVTNFWFLLMISPLIIYIFFGDKDISLSIVVLFSILLGPALTALFSVMGKLIREDEIRPTKDFFHNYKMNFGQAFYIALIINALITICYVDIGYFMSKNSVYMGYLFLAAIVILIMLCFYIYPILSRFNLKILDIFKISLKLVLKKIYITLTIIAMIIIILAIVRFAQISLIGVLFGASIICYIIMRLQKQIMEQLEEELKTNYNLE